MKILVVPDRMEIKGGLETHVTSLAKIWARKNEVMIYSNAIGPLYKKELAKCNLISGWNKAGDDYIVDKFKPDVIIAHPYSGIKLGINIKKRMPLVKLFAVMHGDYSTGLDTGTIPSEDLKLIEKIFPVNQIAKKAISGFISEEKMKIIYNGINTKDFFPTKKHLALESKLGINKAFKTICAITRLQDGKEIPVRQLIKIAPELAKRIDGLNLLICGDGIFFDEVKKQIEKLPECDKLNIITTGEITNVRSYINLADLILGCDRVAMESILCRKLVFYMGQYKWKGLIQNSNYEESLFTSEGLTEYTDEELTCHLTWMVQQDLSHLIQGLDRTIKSVIDIKKIAEDYILEFENSLKKNELS